MNESFPEADKAVERVIIKALNGGDIVPAVNLAARLNREELQNAAVREAAINGIKAVLDKRASKNVPVLEATEIRETFGIEAHIFDEEVLQSLKRALLAKDAPHVLDLMHSYSLLNEIVEDEEIRREAIALTIDMLNQGEWLLARGLLSYFELWQAAQSDAQIRSAAKSCLIKALQSNNVEPIDIQERFKFKDEILESQVREKIMDNVTRRLEIFTPWDFRQRIEEFHLTGDEIHRILIRPEGTDFLAGLISRFSPSNVINFLDENKIPRSILDNPEITEAALEELESAASVHHFSAVAELKENFFIADNDFLDILNRQIAIDISEGYCLDVMITVNKFDLRNGGLDRSELEEVIAGAPLAAVLVMLINEEFKELFPEVELRRQELVEALQVDPATVEDIDFKSDLKKTLDEFGGRGYIGRFKDLPPGVAFNLLKTRPYTAGNIADHIDNFIGLDKMELLDALKTADINVAASFNESLGSPDKALAIAHNLLGDYLTKASYNLIQMVLEGRANPHHLEKLGISQQGEAGLAQLRQKVLTFRSELLREDFDSEQALATSFFKDYFKGYIRYEESEFGSSDDDTFQETITIFNGLKEKGAIRPLAPEYRPSGEILIDKADKEAQENFNYSEQFLSRFNLLRDALSKAQKLAIKEKPLSILVSEAEEIRRGLVGELESKLAKLDNPKAIEHLGERLDQLKAVNFRDLSSFKDNFVTLSKFREFDDILRQATFLIALKKDSRYMSMAIHLVLPPRPETPLFEDVATMVELVGHIINEETWHKYFADHHAAKDFAALTNIRALEEEMARAQNQGRKGTTSFEFVPTRGLLMEFSGHISDACWASHEGHISAGHPNFTAVTMVQNRGTKHERLAGSSMLIEVDSEDGRPLLVIRGLNPLENVINELSVKDFYDKFTSYARGIADALGRELAIVIDGHSGGSATNRPALFAYLSAKKGQLEQAYIDIYGDTTFNGYRIIDNTYLVGEA